MTRISLWLTAASLCGLLLAPGPAAAQVDRFDTRDSFVAAAGVDVQSADFETYPDDTFFQTLTMNGVTFSSMDTNERDLAVYGASLGDPAVQSQTLFANRAPNALMMDFSPPVTAFAADVLTFRGGAGVTVTVEGSGGASSYDVTFGAGGPGFIGLIARSGDISRVTVANLPGGAHFVAVDNVVWGQAEQAPAEATLGECLTALAAAIREGRADGSIRHSVGAGLQTRVAIAGLAVRHNRPRIADRALASLSDRVRALRGSSISEARADQLLDLAARCRALLSGGA